jgi:ribosomal-protein-alanine N-acetyltransferase
MKELLLAKKEHLSLVAMLEEKTFSAPWTEKALEFFLDELNFCVILLEDGDLASYCTVTTVLDEAQIINVATDSRFKRMGMAEQVLFRVFEECSNRGIVSISLEVRESNEGAIALYKKLGFEVLGKRKNFYTEPIENALVMVKNKI